MEEDEQINGIEEGEETPALKYEDLVTEENERDVDLNGVGGVQTLTEAEAGAPSKSDIQAVLKELTPQFASKRMNDLLKPIMVSRIFPDNYLDLNYLLCIMQIEEQEPDADVDFLSILTGVQAGTSIGYEGRHIADLLETAGVVHEEEMEKLSKELGF